MCFDLFLSLVMIFGFWFLLCDLFFILVGLSNGGLASTSLNVVTTCESHYCMFLAE